MTHFGREYGSALFELAQEEHLAEEIHQQMEMLLACFAEQPEYIRLLCTRSIEAQERVRVIDEAFKGSLHPYLLNFLKLLTNRGAMDQFAECAACYRSLYNEAYGIAEATVTSATALNPDQRQALIKRLGEISAKQIVLTEKVDPALIGGLRVDMEGRRYDNSVRERLDIVRRALTGSEGKKA